MKNNKAHRIAQILSAVLVVGCMLLLAVAIADYQANAHAAKPDNPSETSEPSEAAAQFYIVYTDEETRLQARPMPIYHLTLERYETIAEIVAGKVRDKTRVCQTMVANVIYNELLDCDGDIDKAVTKYGLYERAEPTKDICLAVDAIFEKGEWMLDDDVLWFNDKNHPSAFHDSLVFECECDGIDFYREYRPAIVPGGAAE